MRIARRHDSYDEPWSRWIATGTVASRAISTTILGRIAPPYLSAPSDSATRTGLRVSSAASRIAWVISMSLVLKAPTPYWPSRAAFRMSSPVMRGMPAAYSSVPGPRLRGRVVQPPHGGEDRGRGGANRSPDVPRRLVADAGDVADAANLREGQAQASARQRGAGALHRLDRRARTLGA